MKTRSASECIILFVLIGMPYVSGWAADANRFTYLDESDPYYVSGTFPKMLTPQWLGEPGVEAAIFLSIDDMRETEKYEEYLRPILDRLKAIDGRAPVSILTCSIDPKEARLRKWLDEGLSIDVHTITHPCPLLGPEDFAWSKANVDDCVEMMNSVPGNRAVAFRMPCCDSQNTPSPKFFAEIFNGVSSTGEFLRIDSSVFNIATGSDRFRKYLPFPSFVNTIEDYPYPYVIGGLAWEFPCTVPSDWEAHNLHGSNNPRTIEDMKAAIDVSVRSRGTYTLVFHPHGWIRNDQIVELIDYVTDRYGSRARFLTFRDALERIEKNLLKGNALRAADGGDNGVRLMDLDADGVMDVVIGNDHLQTTRLWSTHQAHWLDAEFPTVLVNNPGVRFGTGSAWGDAPVMFECTEARRWAWRFERGEWSVDERLLKGLSIDGNDVLTASGGRDLGARLRDIDGDGQCEFIVANSNRQAVFEWDEDGWKVARYSFPKGVTIVGREGNDAGLRFEDLDGDGDEDIVFSNEEWFGVYVFDSRETGWRTIHEGKRETLTEEGFSIPPIVAEGMNNGAWFHSGTLWWQNEETDELPDGVDRRSYAELLGTTESP